MKIIAELCQNHLGNPDRLLQMAIEARGSGATHAKIQALYSEELVFRSAYEDGSLEAEGLVRPFDKERERLQGLDLTSDTEKAFVDLCNEIGITPMITVFSHRGLDRALKAGFSSFKIASYDCGSRSLISRVLKHSKELVVSTGATVWSEVKKTSELLQQKAPEGCSVALLHARTVYPTPLEQLRLSRMLALAGFGFEVGLSDHSSPSEANLDASFLSLWMGGSVIERHFTILSPSETRDGPVSVNPEQLAEIVDFAHKSKQDQLKAVQGRILQKPEALLCSSLNPDRGEEISSRYYKGRVASWSGSRQVFAWEGWSEDAGS